jgi:glycosyltransferase involved in cell wall biosynthesis
VRRARRIVYKNATIHVVVPAFNEARFVAGVVRSMPAFVDRIFVVDDCSTDDTAGVAASVGDPRVTVLRTPQNLGVGGATVLGYRHALATGADVVVKMDGDGQMSPDALPALLDAVLERGADYAKGNRFLQRELVHRMPVERIVGNVVLTFLTKLASGYWQIFDPQNGYTAVRASVLRVLPLDRIHPGFFFENDMLVRMNVHNFRVVDVPTPTVYGEEHSHLSIPAVMSTFPLLLLRRFFFRVTEKYVIRDFSPIALFLFLGLASIAFGTILGVCLWLRGYHTGLPTPTGSIILCLLAQVVGFQLCLQAIVLDIQASPR